MTHHNLGGTVGGAALAFLLATTSAHAVLIDHGITYTLTESDTANSLTDRFVLTITGINVAKIGTTGDQEGGRKGIDAIAFSLPPNYLGATLIAAPSGSWTTVPGGINSGSCNGQGNFFCFKNSASIPSAVLASNSTLVYTFDIMSATGDFTGYNPNFKIDWVGTENNYDLVGKNIGITVTGNCVNCPPIIDDPPLPVVAVSEPRSLFLLGSAFAGMGWMVRRRRTIHSHVA